MGETHIPDAWLSQLGFSGNPFATREATREPESILVKYFVPPAGFEEFLGSVRQPRSAFLVARRGCGKTTARRAVEWNCREERIGGPVLVVPYTEFSHLVEQASAHGRITPRMYVEEILRRSTPILLTWLANNPTKLELFTEGFAARLAAYLNSYTSLGTTSGLDAWLHESQLLSRNINAQTIRARSFPSSPFLEFIAGLLERQPEKWNIKNVGYVEFLARFVDLAVLAGCKAVYVLIDRVDETEETGTSAERAVDLLEPLVSDLHLMELPHTAFKVFVTPEVEEGLVRRASIRVDRLLFRRIYWGSTDLEKMLDLRIQAFSNGKIPSLDVMCSPNLSGLVRQMADLAEGSPRNLLRLGEWLLHWHREHVSDKPDLILTAADFQKAAASYREEQVSPQKIAAPIEFKHWISIDSASKVWRGEENLGSLPKYQHRLLTYLCEHREKLCTRDELAKAIYGEKTVYGKKGGVSDEMLDKLVQRLRKKIEPNPSHPQILISVPGQGYVLEESPTLRNR